MKKCNCSVGIKVLGDGCEVCNPDMAKEIEEQNRRDEIDELKKQFNELYKIAWKVSNDDSIYIGTNQNLIDLYGLVHKINKKEKK